MKIKTKHAFTAETPLDTEFLHEHIFFPVFIMSVACPFGQCSLPTLTLQVSLSTLLYVGIYIWFKEFSCSGYILASVYSLGVYFRTIHFCIRRTIYGFINEAGGNPFNQK